MRIRFYNARILTMEDPVSVFDGELITEDDRIAFVGTVAQADDYHKNTDEKTFDREIDVRGNLLMPGFKNAHTHSGMTFLRSLADDLPLQSWLNEQVFPREAKLTPEDIYHLTKLANLEYLTSGITSVFEMYLTPESIAEACEDTGMRCVQVGAVNNFSQSLEMVENMYNKLNRENSLNSYILGFHAEYTCSEELLKGIAGLSAKYKAPVYAHNSETEAEVQSCKEHTGGLTPTQYLDSLGMFEYGGGGYHCVYLDEKDIDIFARKGLYVVTNPSSNAKLASGIAPISAYHKAGIGIAIGTDGPASNNCLDMFREMFLVSALAKVLEKDASAMDAVEVLKMATVSGARAMGLTDCDVLSAGKKADIIMIDLKQPNMQPINNIPKNIVYSGSKSNVIMTMINGVIRYENGSFAVGEDAESICRKAQEITERIV